ncbi:MAG: 4-hydroxy-tetrahydrodipicolinate synthase, partial [Alloprevotella sp.]
MGIALVTPFLEDGSVDFAALEKLVEYQIAEGADFLCVLGTTAETPCLAPDEQQAIISTVRRVNAGRVPLLLGAGGNCTRHVVEGLQRLDVTGLSGVLIVCPYYNKPTQEGLYQHFAAVAEASPLPVVLYNVPGRTGVNLEAETTLRIARDYANVVAIKEASGKLDQIAHILQHAPEGFDVLSGDDALTYDMIGMGAKGVISVIGNAYPALFTQMVHDARDGRQAEALATHQRLTDMYELMTRDGNPAGVKDLLATYGRIYNVLRLPLVPVTDQT